MGFKRNQNRSAIQGHKWSNHPDSMHRICTRFGCSRVQTQASGKSVHIYYDRYGNELDGNPECKSLMDLLNEE